MAQEKFLLCDFDGTVILQNLETRFLRFLIQNNKLSLTQWTLALVFTPINIALNKINRPSLVKVWRFGLSEERLSILIQEFLEAHGSTITFNQPVVDFVRAYKGHKTLLTGCYEPLAAAFLAFSGQDSLFDDVIGAQTGASNFFLIRHPYARAKRPFVPTGKTVTGIGNEYADRFYLSDCHEAFITNPEEKLNPYAQKQGWKNL